MPMQFMVNQLAGLISPADRRKLIIELSETYSQRQIAEKVGVSRTTVVNVQKKWRNPLPAGRPKTITEEMMDTAISMRGDGAAWRDIGAAVGVSVTGIRKAVQRRNEAADEAYRSGSDHSQNN